MEDLDRFPGLILPQWFPPRSSSPRDIWRSLETLWLLQLSGCCQQLVGRVGCCQTSHKGQEGSPGKMSIVLNLRNPVQICSNPTGIHRRKRRWKADESVVTSSLKGEYIKPSTPLTHRVSSPAFAASPLLALLGWVFSLAPLSPLSPPQNPTLTPPMYVLTHGGFP